MYGEFIVIGEGYYVITESLESVIYVGRPVFTFVHYDFDAGVRVEVCPFPAICSVETSIGVVYVGTGKRIRTPKTINRTETCRCYGK